MKIGFDAKRVFHNTTGLGVYSRVLLNHLSRDLPDHQYHLFSPKLSNHAFAVPYRRHPYATHNFKGPKLLGAAWRRMGIAQSASKQQVQLYHGLSHELPIGLAKRGIGSVVTIHDLIFERYPEFYPWIDRQLYRRKIKHACRVADRIVAISQATRQDLIDFYGVNPQKISVIYQTCEDRFWEVMQKGQKLTLKREWQLPSEYILVVGAGRRKNVPLILHSRGRGDFDRLPLVVVGNSRYLKAYMGKLGMMEGEYLRILENLSTEELVSLYQHASVLVYASEFEGFGIPILEALITGLPVISANNSALPEAGGAGSVYVDSHDRAEMSAAIQRVLTDSDLRRNMIQAGYDHAQNFAPGRLSQQWNTLYQEVMNQ